MTKSRTVSVTAQSAPPSQQELAFIQIAVSATEVDVGQPISIELTAQDQYRAPLAGPFLKLFDNGKLLAQGNAGADGKVSWGNVLWPSAGQHELNGRSEDGKIISGSITVKVIDIPPPPPPGPGPNPDDLLKPIQYLTTPQVSVTKIGTGNVDIKGVVTSNLQQKNLQFYMIFMLVDWQGFTVATSWIQATALPKQTVSSVARVQGLQPGRQYTVRVMCWDRVSGSPTAFCNVGSKTFTA